MPNDREENRTHRISFNSGYALDAFDTVCPRTGLCFVIVADGIETTDIFCPQCGEQIR